MTIKLMSHNVWGMYAPDVVKKVANRNELMRNVYMEYLPDVIGTQEFSEDIRVHGLPEMISSEYIELDVSADVSSHGMKNLFTPIFYRPSTCTPVDAGFVLYDRAYNNHDSKGVVWAVFRDFSSGELFTVANTHYWWKSGEEHDAARVENSKEILKLAKRLPHPFFVMGDMNCKISSQAYKELLNGGLCDAQAVAKQSMDSNTHHQYPPYDYEKGVFYGSPKPQGGYAESIDHILVDADHSNMVARFFVVTSDAACNTSDHCPVLVEYENKSR